MIRARLHKGLQTGKMSVGSLMRDEKLKMKAPRACAYCGSQERLSGDHLLPTKLGGSDAGENLVLACRSCNSSKCGHDFLEWWERKHGSFPPLMLLRRYLKLSIEYSRGHNLLEHDLGDLPPLPFRIDHIPTTYPGPTEAILIVPERAI